MTTSYCMVGVWVVSNGFQSWSFIKCGWGRSTRTKLFDSKLEPHILSLASFSYEESETNFYLRYSYLNTNILMKSITIYNPALLQQAAHCLHSHRYQPALIQRRTKIGFNFNTKPVKIVSASVLEWSVHLKQGIPQQSRVSENIARGTTDQGYWLCNLS